MPKTKRALFFLHLLLFLAACLPQARLLAADADKTGSTTWNYDAATGLLTSKVYADGHGPSYTYTADGRIATRTWARKDALNNDLVTTYSYNLSSIK